MGSGHSTDKKNNHNFMTENEFNRAVRKCGYLNPPIDVYPHLSKATKNYKRWELAMLLAHLIHDSGGFQYREERYIDPNDYTDSEIGLPGKSYHGRGYIQISCAINYKLSSQAINMGDKLLKCPELVAEDTELAVKVSIWYWEKTVRPKLEGKDKRRFGITTMALNETETKESAMKRYRHYRDIAEVLDIPQDQIAFSEGFRDSDSDSD